MGTYGEYLTALHPTQQTSTSLEILLRSQYCTPRHQKNVCSGRDNDEKRTIIKEIMFKFKEFFFIKNKNYVCMYGCVYVCQFPLAAYYGKVARARMVKFSHKIRPVQPFVVLKFQGCAINGVRVRGASLPHFGSGRRRRRVTRAGLRFLAVKTERF